MVRMDASHHTSPAPRGEASRRTALTRRTAAATGLALACLLPVGLALSSAVPAADPAAPARQQAGRAPGEEGLSERELRVALLDHMDFPVGWASDSPRAADRRGVGVPRPEETPCRALFAGGGEDDTAEEATRVRAGFARTQSGPFVTTVATTHPDRAAARRAVAELRDAARGPCHVFHAREGPKGSAVTVAYEADRPDALRPELDRIQRLERLSAGDQDSAALRFHRRADDGGGAPVVADVVVVRIGVHTVRVAQAGRDDASTGSVAEIAARAVEKLAEVCAGRTPTPEPNQPGTTDL